ncbi:MAG TPA: HD domain-containing protein [Sunxiuqinia sp.]|nr:HD domain-containing protein [Sunxiuqinia sp.]
MKRENHIQNTIDFIHKHFKGESSGHDWWHIYRVWQLAKQLAEEEKADLFLVEMAALLHDLDDWKLSSKSDNEPKQAARWMNEIDVEPIARQRILTIIEEVSFKGAGVKTNPSSLEAQVVQDADRLDAIGAIGIARTFAYGGRKNRLIYDPAVKPEMHDSFSDYQKSTAPTINHFYEKLLLLKDRMNTSSGRQIAEERHHFMEDFLTQFFHEWNASKELLTN